MENISNFSIELEQEKLNEDMEILASAEGFHSLTENQKRIIKQSLYVQARAERGTDRASAFAIVSPKTNHVTDITRISHEDHLIDMHRQGYGEDPNIRKYRTSQNHVANWYCHAAIANLEQEKGFDVEPEKIPDGFFKAEYHSVKSLDDVKKMIEDFGVPCVLHISASMEKFNDSPDHKHSCLVLGVGSNSSIVVWEKQGGGLPYRVTTIDEVYDTYSNNYYYGLRKLS